MSDFDNMVETYKRFVKWIFRTGDVRINLQCAVNFVRYSYE